MPLLLPIIHRYNLTVRSQKHPSHPILVVTKKKKKKNLTKVNTYCSLPQRDQRNCYAADIIMILDDSDVAIKNGLDATIS